MKSVIAMTATTCSIGMLAAKSILQIVLMHHRVFLQECSTSKWWSHWHEVEAWKRTNRTSKTCQFNQIQSFFCRHLLEHNCSGKKRQTKERFMDDALKTKGIKSQMLRLGCSPFLLKIWAMRLDPAYTKVNDLRKNLLTAAREVYNLGNNSLTESQ